MHVHSERRLRYRRLNRPIYLCLAATPLLLALAGVLSFLTGGSGATRYLVHDTGAQPTSSSTRAPSQPPSPSTLPPMPPSHNLQPCPVDGRPVPGAWLDGGTLSDTRPPCCTWDAHGRQLAGASDAGAGSGAVGAVCNLSRIVLEHGGDWSSIDGGLLAPSGGGGCSCSAARERAAAQPEWTPSACTLPAWDAAAFCASLAGRRLLFIGDSTSQQVAAAIHNEVVSGGGGCGAQLAHANGDTLTGRAYGVRNLGCAWLDCIAAARAPPDIVVVGAGPHVATDEGMVDILTTVRAQLAEAPAARNISLIWRTSIGAGSTRPGEPLQPRTLMPRDEPGYWQALAETQKTYNYEAGERWDAEAVQFWQGVPRAAILDLSPLWLRPDAMVSSGSEHPTNCQHVCSPGPLRLAARQLALLLKYRLPAEAPLA